MYTADDLLGKVYEMDVWVEPYVRETQRFTVNEIKGGEVRVWLHSAKQTQAMSHAALCDGLREGLVWEVAVPPHSSPLLRPLV